MPNLKVCINTRTFSEIIVYNPSILNNVKIKSHINENSVTTITLIFSNEEEMMFFKLKYANFSPKH